MNTPLLDLPQHQGEGPTNHLPPLQDQQEDQLSSQDILLSQDQEEDQLKGVVYLPQVQVARPQVTTRAAAVRVEATTAPRTRTAALQATRRSLLKPTKFEAREQRTALSWTGMSR